MIWKSLFLKLLLLCCATAFVIILNLQVGSREPTQLASDRDQQLALVPTHTAAVGSPKSKALQSQSRFDLNTAGVAQLVGLPGIGVTLAQRIVEFRDQHGSFEQLTMLMAVKGIGPKRFTKIKPFLWVSTP